MSFKAPIFYWGRAQGLQIEENLLSSDAPEQNTRQDIMPQTYFRDHLDTISILCMKNFSSDGSLGIWRVSF
jgi:hypothetical protein